jgi:uncharacterized protein YijF (DUF1287 family)
MGLNRRTALGMLVATPMIGASRGLGASGFSPSGERLAQAARGQVGVTKDYDPSYRAIPYPNGDVLRSTGVCADVLIRAARDAWRVDLQQLVHEDMTRDFDAYPSRRAWGLKGPDSNIDHRRVLNLETYLTRQGARLALAPGQGDRRPFRRSTAGRHPDLARLGRPSAHRRGQRRPRAGAGRPQHRRGAREEPLWMFKLHTAVAHYRWRI